MHFGMLYLGFSLYFVEKYSKILFSYTIESICSRLSLETFHLIASRLQMYKHAYKSLSSQLFFRASQFFLDYIVNSILKNSKNVFTYNLPADPNLINDVNICAL